MRKTATILAALFLVICCTEVLAAENPRAEFEERRRAVAAKMEAATIWIIAEDDTSITSGSGFIVGDGYIATNAHVIDELESGGSVYVLNELIPARKASIVAKAYDKVDDVGGRDFALLRFDPPKGVTLPILTFNVDVKRMDRVSAWGYPDMSTKFDVRTERLHEGDTSGLESPPVIYSEGTVNAIVRAKSGDAILHSAQIAGGNSGGPLVNGRGEVVGMNTWGYQQEDEGAFLNGAQPANEVCRFLLENGITPKFADGQKLLPPSPRPKTEGATGRKPQERTEDRRRDAGDFSVLVPRGWSVIDKEENLILLGSDDRQTSVGIMFADLEGNSLYEISKAISQELDATEPEWDDEDELYVFTYTSDDVETMVVTCETGDGEQFLMVSISGDMEKPEVGEILDSVEYQ